MPRIARLIVSDQKTVYHVMSGTALDRFPFGDSEKDELVQIIKRFSKLYFAEILGFCAMGNHILTRLIPEHHYSDNEIEQRYKRFYGEDDAFPSGKIEYFRQKWQRLSEFIKEVKQFR